MPHRSVRLCGTNSLAQLQGEVGCSYLHIVDLALEFSISLDLASTSCAPTTRTYASGGWANLRPWTRTHERWNSFSSSELAYLSLKRPSVARLFSITIQRREWKAVREELSEDGPCGKTRRCVVRWLVMCKLTSSESGSRRSQVTSTVKARLWCWRSSTNRATSCCIKETLRAGSMPCDLLMSGASCRSMSS